MKAVTPFYISGVTHEDMEIMLYNSYCSQLAILSVTKYARLLIHGRVSLDLLHKSGSIKTSDCL